MYSDDEDGFALARGAHSPSPPARGARTGQDRGQERRESARDDDRRRARSSERQGKGESGRARSRERSGRGEQSNSFLDRAEGGKGKSGGRTRTTGRELPRLHSIHKGVVVRVQDYGAFVRLGDGDRYKDGLVHISRLSASGRVDSVEDVVSQDDAVWVKVCEVKEEEGKFSVDMRFVNQRTGEDLDPNNVQAESGGNKGKGKGPEPIRIGAVQATTCSRCGSKGHMAKECWAGSGKQYNLIEEQPEEDAAPDAGRRKQVEPNVDGHDPELVKAALKEYFKRKAAGEKASSSSDSSSSKKKKKKKKDKALKKQKKKEKKAEKKIKKAKKDGK